MKQVLDFLADIRANNNRDWFEANKTRYKEVQAYFNDFAARLIEGIASFDSSVRGLSVKDCTYRIYRDTRFSHNKDPYKTHMGVYVCPGGKKSGNAGYYFHVEPKGEGLLGGNLMSGGLYMPEPVVLKSVREDIDTEGEAYVAAIKKAKGFTLCTDNKLKRLPAGYPADSPYAEYLKLKDVYIEKRFGDDYLLDNRLLENAVADFRTTRGLVDLLNRAAQYAREEM